MLALILTAGCSGNRADSEASALDYFKRGNAAYQKEDFRHAIRMYQQAATLDPRSAVIQFNLGLACYQAHSYPDAVQAYTRALQLDPNFADAHRNLALTEDRLYNLEAAQFHYNAYQAMVRAQQTKADAGAGEAKGDAVGAQPSAGSGAPATAKNPSRPAPKQTASSSKDGAPASISEVRRYGGESKTNESSVKSGGDGKWWTQDSSSRNR